MTHPAASPLSSSAQSFRAWSQAQPLSDALSRVAATIRAKPQEAEPRWLMFELLCVLGQWERALRQLQTWAGLSANADGTAQVMRGLIRAEAQRVDVFNGRALAATASVSMSPPPPWMEGLSQALKLAASSDPGSIDAADLIRDEALAQAPETHGASNLLPVFDWVADSDTRLGPVCELNVAGAYRWLSFGDISSIEKDAPRTLLDLVWSPVDMIMRDGTPLSAYMPMRYPVRDGDRDALLLARETVWNEAGRTGVHGRGQKMWMTDAGDMSLLDLRHCALGGDPAISAVARSNAEEGAQGDAGQRFTNDSQQHPSEAGNAAD